METEQLLNEVIVNTPQIGALAWIVWVFIKHLDRRDQVIKEISEECHSVHNRSIEAVNENKELMGRNTQVLGQVEKFLHRIESGQETLKH